ncbi:MAG: protein phosphatase, partial [Gammaproteobacteria bacterium]|nr:protein phosphatase [Gammaproteobacteria bacterium]
VAPNDLFLMCSDGLTDMVTDADLAEMVRAPLALEEKATLLIDTANANGGRDNVSVLLVQAAAGGKKRGLMSRLLGAA